MKIDFGSAVGEGYSVFKMNGLSKYQKMDHGNNLLIVRSILGAKSN